MSLIDEPKYHFQPLRHKPPPYGAYTPPKPAIYSAANNNTSERYVIMSMMFSRTPRHIIFAAYAAR